MSFECDNCEYIFGDLKGYNYHVDNKVCFGKKFFCEQCGKGFTKKNSMYRHSKKTCKERDTSSGDSDIRKRLVKLERENDNLKKKVIKLEKSDRNMNVTTNNGMINNGMINNGTINNNITIVAYGKEDMSYIDRDDIIRALKTGFNSTKHLTEVVHFNPKYPNYSNIKRNNYNMKNKIMYHDGRNWVTTSDPHMIDDLYNRKRDFIEENIEHYQDALTQGDMTRLQRWLDVNDDDQRITRIKTDLRDMLFNKKHVAEMNESKSTVQFVTIENLDSMDKKVDKKPKKDNKREKIIIMCKNEVNKCIKKKRKPKLAGRPGTKRKYVKIKRSK
jgi:hypothetical protein